MDEKATKSLLPAIILGLSAGAISVARGFLPITIGRYSGLSVIGSPFGYLFVILVAAWMYRERYTKSLCASLSSVLTALLTFYTIITVLYYLFSITPIHWWMGSHFFPPWPMGPSQLRFSLTQFAMWGGTAAAFCVLITFLVRLYQRTKSKVFKLILIFLTYAGMTGLVYNVFVRRVIGAVEAARDVYSYRGMSDAVGFLCEAGIAFLLTTILFGLVLRATLKRSA